MKIRVLPCSVEGHLLLFEEWIRQHEPQEVHQMTVLSLLIEWILCNEERTTRNQETSIAFACTVEILCHSTVQEWLVSLLWVSILDQTLKQIECQVHMILNIDYLIDNKKQ